jgi:hypothetical protein
MAALARQTPLAKAIRRALTHPSHGLTSVRRHVRAQVARWQSEGVAEGTILSALMSVASDVARQTGSDRIDLLTGEPRWRYVADAIRTTVLESRPSAPAVRASDDDVPARDGTGAKAGDGAAELYATVPFPVG